MSSSPLPNRETYRLAKGRVSISGKRYFVTICTRNRYPHFIKQKDRVLGIQILNEMDQASDLHLHCTTFMPDHVHLLFALGESLSLQRVIAKFKANVKRQFFEIETGMSFDSETGEVSVLRMNILKRS